MQAGLQNHELDSDRVIEDILRASDWIRLVPQTQLSAPTSSMQQDGEKWFDPRGTKEVKRMGSLIMVYIEEKSEGAKTTPS